MPNQAEISVHDNRLTSYTVYAKERKIVLHTEFVDKEPHEYTDVLFEEVLAYDFVNDLFGTIIFDVVEIPPADILKQSSDMFQEGWRYGWPRGWEKNKETIDSYVSRLGMRGFELSSSYGMSGWVLAKLVQRVKVPKPTS